MTRQRIKPTSLDAAYTSAYESYSKALACLEVEATRLAIKTCPRKIGDVFKPDTGLGKDTGLKVVGIRSPQHHPVPGAAGQILYVMDCILIAKDGSETSRKVSVGGP